MAKGKQPTSAPKGAPKGKFDFAPKGDIPKGKGDFGAKVPKKGKGK